MISTAKGDQLNQESTNFLQGFTSSPYGPYQSTLAPTFPGSFLPKQSSVQQNVTHGSALNDYSVPDNTGGQSGADYLPLDYDAELNTFLESGQNVNSYPQAFKPFTLDMSTANPDFDVPTDSIETAGAETQLRCRFPSCSEDRDFPTESSLRKHQDKHSKPYLCGVPGCKHPRFGDKGGLDRHTREVHGTQSYRCPITSCRRYTKGFPRKYNLFEHQKRCHPGQSQNPSMLSARISRDRTRFHHEGFEEGRDGDEEASSSETMGTGDMAGTGSGRLHEKLIRLYAEKAELDRNIEALKRTMDMMGDSSP